MGNGAAILRLRNPPRAAVGIAPSLAMADEVLHPTPGYIEPDTQPLGDEAFAANSSSDDEGSHHSPAVVQQVGGGGGGGGRVRKRLLDDGTAAKTSPAEASAEVEAPPANSSDDQALLAARASTEVEAPPRENVCNDQELLDAVAAARALGTPPPPAAELCVFCQESGAIRSDPMPGCGHDEMLCGTCAEKLVRRLGQSPDPARAKAMARMWCATCLQG